MLKASEFIKQLKMAANVQTLYVMGGWGFPLNKENKKRTFIQPYNCKPERKAKINAASSSTFAFDCCGLPRAILWGWNGDVNERNGGAVYCSNGVPEYDAKQFMFQGCIDPTTDFSHIDPGEFLWFNGHCGVYLGDNRTIESTPSGRDGVQIRTFDSRWTHHGHLKYVDYSGVKPDPEPETKYHSGSVYTVQCTGPLMIRSGPTTDRAIIDNLYKGDKVLCDGTVKDADGNTWMRIIGYAAAEYDGEVYIK